MDVPSSSAGCEAWARSARRCQVLAVALAMICGGVGAAFLARGFYVAGAVLLVCAAWNAGYLLPYWTRSRGEWLAMARKWRTLEDWRAGKISDAEMLAATKEAA